MLHDLLSAAILIGVFGGIVGIVFFLEKFGGDDESDPDRVA